MSQHYTNKSRESNPYALPDIETFRAESGDWYDERDEPNEPGWYYWPCFPGCLPDGDAIGPFETEQDALNDAREGFDEDDFDSDGE